MAADTQVVVSPSGKGGARPGSGAKPGQKRIAHEKLRAALEAGLGFPYEEMLAQINSKLFNDFKNDENVKEFLMFNENMNKRILQDQAHEMNVVTSEVTHLSDDDLKARLVALQSKAASSNESKE